MDTEMRLRACRLASLLLLAVGGIFVLAATFCRDERSLFKRLVVTPIPRSVQSIRIDRRQMSSLLDRFDGFDEHAFVLRFEINAEDISRIVALRGFTLWSNVRYSEGALQYKSSDQFVTNIRLYTKHDAPSWFDLDKWAGFETYFVGKDTTGLTDIDVSLLLYNQDLGSAYLIKWEITGLR